MTSASPRRTDDDQPAYDALRRRAVDALHTAHSPLTDAELARAMFGSAHGAASAVLVRSILAGDDRVTLTDGRWTLALAPSARNDTEHIVALALATNGADPHHHRIVRLALVRFDGAQVTARLDTLIRPDRDLPGYLQATTGATSADLESAPTFGSVWDQVTAVTDGAPIYAYGARRATEFLESEASRAGLRHPDIQIIEADTQIRPLLPAGAKPGLLAAARELAVPYARPGVPISDAEALARVIYHIRMRVQAAPPRAEPPPPDDEALFAGKPLPLPFTRSWLATVPDGPGVYLLRDTSGAVLYVGKAHSLIRRMASYVQRQPSANRQLEALAVRAASAQTIATESDLEATLLEARLIREHAPDFNVAQTVRLPRTFLRAGLDDASPRLQQVAEARPDGARYFGPYASASVAQAALDVVRAVYPDAAARRRGDVPAQRIAVLEACKLLAGQKASAIATLQAEMRAAASSGDQRELDRLRAALRDVQALDLQPSILAGLRPGTELLVLEYVQEGLTRAHLLRDGARLVSVSWEIDYLPSDPSRLRSLADAMLAAAEATPAEDEVDADVSAPTGPPHPDEPGLVMRWLLQARTRIELAPVPREDN